MAFVWLLLLSLVFAPTEAAAERKAFVASVNNYASLDKLQTPQADAAAVSDLLKSVGFKVTYAKDPSLSQFNKAWETFLASVDQTDVVTVYFAGHGIQSDAVNYLLLRDTPKALQDAPALKKASLNFHELMEQLELKSPLASIYILDACRNNPFAANSRSALGQTKGLAKVEAIYGAFVLYSAGPDEEAIDQLGAGDKNSLFAIHLLPTFKEKLISIVEASKRIQSAVEEAARTKANHKQRPAYFDGILGHFYFADVDNPFRSGRPAPLATSEKVIYMTGGSQWRGKDCHPYAPPKVKLLTQPKYGRVVTSFTKEKQREVGWGDVKCAGTEQRKVKLYYAMNEDAVGKSLTDSFQVALHYDEGQDLTRVLEFTVNLDRKTAPHRVLRSR